MMDLFTLVWITGLVVLLVGIFKKRKFKGCLTFSSFSFCVEGED
jgi:hypothetical protein